MDTKKVHLLTVHVKQHGGLALLQVRLAECLPSKTHTLTDTGGSPPNKVQQQQYLQHVLPNHTSALPTFNLRKDVVTCTQRQLTADTNRTFRFFSSHSPNKYY